MNIVNNVINIGNIMVFMQPLVNTILVVQVVRSKIKVLNVKIVMKIRKIQMKVIFLVKTSMLVVRVVITEISI